MMVQERKVICDGCGKDITNSLINSAYTIQLRKKWIVFRVWWAIRQSFPSGKIRRPWIEDDFCYHADLCEECFLNVCKYADTKSKEVK